MLSINDPRFKDQLELLDILYLYNEEKETWIVFFDNHTQQCVSVAGAMTRWEKQLPGFWRINDCYLINPALIYRFHPAELPHFPLPLIELVTGRQFAVSRQQTKTILQKWNLIQQSLIS
ncbi:hypothetical protein GCM10027299_40950 [Larkinella ripae]